MRSKYNVEIAFLYVFFTLGCRFKKYVEGRVAANPKEARLGGKPSIEDKVKAFLRIKYCTYGTWEKKNLEVRLYFIRKFLFNQHKFSLWTMCHFGQIFSFC
jgi:hypothetical protein